MQSVKIALGYPFYSGPDRDCFVHHAIFHHYLGRLQERLLWMNHTSHTLPPVEVGRLDPVNSTGFSEIPTSLAGTTFEFCICDETGCSLPGLARERIVDSARIWGADWLLFYDSDMVFGTDAFLRLYLNQKDVCGALAFTARRPVTPVIYKFRRTWNEEAGCPSYYSEPIVDYPRNQLTRVDGVGFGMVLIRMSVFDRIRKPWFHSPGVGEDILFCSLCCEAGVEVWVDTRVKTIHKPTFPLEWHDEAAYDKQLAGMKAAGLMFMPA